MHISAKLRPRGLKPGVRTEAFYKAMGLKSEYGPDIRDVVGTLELSVTQREEFAFLAEVHKCFGYWNQDGRRLVVMGKDGKEIASYGPTEDAEHGPDVTCDSCEIIPGVGHQLDCPEAQE